MDRLLSKSPVNASIKDALSDSKKETKTDKKVSTSELFKGKKGIIFDAVTTKEKGKLVEALMNNNSKFAAELDKMNEKQINRIGQILGTDSNIDLMSELFGKKDKKTKRINKTESRVVPSGNNSALLNLPGTVKAPETLGELFDSFKNSFN